MPDLSRLKENTEVYADLHTRALRDGDFGARALACWGLIARSQDALPWIERGLTSRDDDVASDAAGVLAWIGVPAAWVPRLREQADRLPDGERRDTLLQALPADPSEEEEAGPAGSGVLFGDEMAAFTETIWFIDRPLEEALQGIFEGHTDFDRKRVPLHGPLKELLAHLEPWSFSTWKTLIVAAKGSWTAMFSQGADVYLFDVAARHLKCRSLRTRFSPHVRRDGRIVNYGGCAFWLADGSQEGGGLYLRTIQASYQSRWEWHLQGEQQSFE